MKKLLVLPAQSLIWLVVIIVPPLLATPLNPNNILVSDNCCGVDEYTPDGVLVQTIPFTYGWRSYSEEPTEYLRDITVDAYGHIDVFNGTGNPFLSRFDVSNGSFEHLTFPQWRISNTSGRGKIAAFQQYVFAEDETAGRAGSYGIVRFDLALHQTQRFAVDTAVTGLGIGVDGKLYVLVTPCPPGGDCGGTRVNIYDPITMALIRYVDLPFSQIADLSVVAADRTGTIFVAGLGDVIYRLNSQGQVDRQYSTGQGYFNDIKIDDTDRLIAGNGARTVFVMDTGLVSATSFQAHGGYVSFARPVPALTSPLPSPVPTPAPTPTPVPTHDIFVSFLYSVQEFTPDGVPINHTTFQYPTGPYFGYECLHDIVVTPDRKIIGYNGTLTPYLTTYSPATNSFSSSATFPGWNYLNYTEGGALALYNNFVFAPDLDGSVFSPDLAPSGIIRFNIADGSAARFFDGSEFFDLNVGLDGKLYAMFAIENSDTFINVYDPTSMQLLRQITVPKEVSDDRLDAIAVDQQGRIYLAGDYGAIYRLDSSGNLDASLATGYPRITDIEVDETGKIVASEDEGYVVTTYCQLDRSSAFPTITAGSGPYVTVSIAVGPMGTPAPTPPPAPVTVSLSVSPSSIGKGGSANFTLSTATPVTQPITINYSMSGNAVLGTDYTLSGNPDQVMIPAGQSSSMVTLTVTTTKTKGKEKATMTLGSGSGYNFSMAGKSRNGKSPKATVTISNK